MASRSRQERTSRSARPDEDPEHPDDDPEAAEIEVVAAVDGDLINGGVIDGEAVDGDVINGGVIEDEAVDGDVINGDAVDGDVIDADVIDGDVVGDPTDDPVGFREFGGALISDVVTERFVRDRLDAALRNLLDSDVIPPDFVADITSARVDTVTCMSDDGGERCFAVTVGALLEADVGPRLLALGVDARIKIDLTIRVRAFRPGTLGFDIDEVSPNDVWMRARTRTGWLPFALGDGGLSTLTRSAQRAVPKLCTTVNAALEDAIDQRRVDVLAHLEHYGDPRTAHPAERTPRAGREIDFAEFGAVLMHRGVDRRVVAAAVESQLVEPVRVALEEPVPVHGTIDVRVAHVASLSGGPDELRYRLVLLADAELMVSEGDRRGPVTAKVRVDLRARLTTRTDPATLVIDFEPLKRLRVVRVRKEVRGRMMIIPLPNQTLAPLRRKVTAEVNRRLAGSGTRLVAAELVEQVLTAGARRQETNDSRR